MFSNAHIAPIGEVTGPLSTVSGSSRPDVFLFDLNVLFDAHQGQMAPAFATYLRDFADQRLCYLLSNLNYAEIASRVPASVLRSFAGTFASAGTELWCKDDVLIRHEHCFSDDLFEFLAKVVLSSRYPFKQAPLIDNGPATLRVCLAGTRAGRSAKRAYLAWEREHRELDEVIKAVRMRFPDHSICKDTETSLLITPASYSTAMVQDHILRRHKSARVIGYLSEAAAEGFAKPLCNAFLDSNIWSTVAGASDVSQLLSYEKRRMSEVAPRLVLES